MAAICFALYQHLNAHEQRLERQYHKIAYDDGYGVSDRAEHLRKHEHDLHHTGMDKDERSHSEEAHRVRHIRETDLEHFKDIVDDEGTDAPAEDILLAFQQLRERFSQKDQDQRQDDQEDDVDRRHKVKIQREF